VLLRLSTKRDRSVHDRRLDHRAGGDDDGDYCYSPEAVRSRLFVQPALAHLQRG
jgi:hypothetical protein